MEYFYRWHDLGKNPDDLPHENGQYLTCTVNFNYTWYSMLSYIDGKWVSDDQYKPIDVTKLVAWKEVERFAKAPYKDNLSKMSRKDWMKINFPDLVGENYMGGVYYCPKDFPTLPDSKKDICYRAKGFNCEYCWN